MPHAEGVGPHIRANFLRADDEGSRGVVVGSMDMGQWTVW
jgi:hypothetical protein